MQQHRGSTGCWALAAEWHIQGVAVLPSVALAGWVTWLHPASLAVCRVLLPDGTAGKRLGPWLRDHGFDTRPLPAPKRKRDQQQQLQQAAGVRRNLSGVGVIVGGMVVGGSQPGSPLTRGPLSPSKSAKIESVPASPRCPHCRGGGAACGSMPSAAPSPHQPTHAHTHAHCPTHGPADSAAAIKRSLEAFLAGLPPSAQAALGCVVGAAPAYPPHPDPAATGPAALSTWQNKVWLSGALCVSFSAAPTSPRVSDSLVDLLHGQCCTMAVGLAFLLPSL